MKAKTIIIGILAAAVLVGTSAAQSYGEKSRPDSVGDTVFDDGSATAWHEGLRLTDEQKMSAVAVIFYVGTECSNNGEKRILGVGLAQKHLLWCTEDASAYSVNIATIQCEESGSKGMCTFSGDKDGSDNLEQMGAYLSENGIENDTAYKSHYPAFYFAKNYAEEVEESNVFGTKFGSGWYLPSSAELFQIWKSRETVNAALASCGGMPFDLEDGCYWSSTQAASLDYFALSLVFSDGGFGMSSKYYGNDCACAIRAFHTVSADKSRF